MDPSATPPWHVLETPPADRGPRPDDQHPRETASVSPTIAVKAIVIGAAALLCVVIAVVLAVGSGDATVRMEGGAPIDATGAPDGSPAAGDPGVEIVVEIVGAVQEPGVYRLPPGSRLADLVRKAGGYGPRVDTGRAEQELNLAATLKDGDHIRVPSRDDAAAMASPTGGTAANGGITGAPVQLNRATQAELEALPGIGPATAQKIITAREEAPFTAVDELRSRGILGEKTFEKLRDLVTVG
jgi:competence protein ComEA